MNWRFLFSLAVTFGLRAIVVQHLNWGYHPLDDPFDLLLFGREVLLFLLLLGAVLAVVNAVLGTTKDTF